MRSSAFMAGTSRCTCVSTFALSYGARRSVSHVTHPSSLGATKELQDAAALAKANGDAALDRMKRRDIAMKVVSRCGRYRISAVTTTSLLQTIIDRHELHCSDAPFLNLLGTQLSFTNLLAAMGEGEERVECRFESQFGAACVSESLALGECRAYVATGQSELVLPNTLSVKRVLYNHRSPVTSVTSARFETELPEEVLRDSLRFIGSGPGSWDNVNAQSHSNDALWSKYAAPAEKRAKLGFLLNLTPHAVHFFRQSEGIPSAVLLTTSVEDVTPSDGGSSSGKKVIHSGGVLVQPLAHSTERDNDVPPAIEKLQRLFTGMTLCPVPPTVGSIAMAALDDRNFSEGILAMDLLALASGDYEGARDAAKAARIAFSDDVETTTAQYQLIRDPYALKAAPSVPRVEGAQTKPICEDGAARNGVAACDSDGSFIALDPATLTRSALDFTCRCSADGFRDAILAVPEAQMGLAGDGVQATCIFCNKQFLVKKPPPATE